MLPADGMPRCDPVDEEQQQANSGKNGPDHEGPIGNLGEDFHALKNDDGRQPIDDDAEYSDVDAVLGQIGHPDRVGERDRAKRERHRIPDDVLDPLQPDGEEAPADAECLADPGVNAALFVGEGAAEFGRNQ